MVALERLEGQRVDGEGVHAAPRELVPAPINAVAPGRFERSPRDVSQAVKPSRLIEQSRLRGLATACGLVSSSRGPT
jgi:hypothetical protein